ncbi:hypothetical protein [Bacillus cereus]|uniref:hypothetical protein n=1 Tax=Bacillus cereus TaxID=1396 RepID=UPI003C2EFF89
MNTNRVAPYIGAWIEIPWMRRCAPKEGVAPYIGAWIEIGIMSLISETIPGRTLYRCVD